MAEILRVSTHGFYLLLGREELQIKFKRFPWFRRVARSQLANVEWHGPGRGRLYWPQLEVNLSVEFIREPERQFTSAMSSISTHAPIGI